ncbi:MAG: ABC-F family ATP-binding cassette domain-containing protein [Bacillota bacterium]
MSVLSITNLTHSANGQNLFEEANLDINNGEKVGIVGLNGAGKTTFMSILTGHLLQDSGEVKWLSSIKWGYLDQHANIPRDITIMQYLEGSFSELFAQNERMNGMYMKMAEDITPDEMDELMEKAGKIQDRLMTAGFYEIETEIKKVATGLGVHNFGFETLISTLSGGQRAKVILAKLLIDKPSCMLLDEPTNFLDIEHVEWLKKYLQDFDGTIIIISHDTAFLNETVKLIVNIENRKITRYPGNYDSFIEQRENNAKQYEEAFARQQREIKKMETFIAKNKARAATAGMANSRQKLLDKMDVLDKPRQIYEAEFTFPYVELVAKEMVKAENLEIGYNKKAILPKIDILLSSQQKIWIKGTNGIGKSTLIKTLVGLLPKIAGEYSFHSYAKIGYLEQDLNFSECTLNPSAYLNELYPRKNNRDIKAELAKVGIKNDLMTRQLCNMSGGEQVRVKLCALCQESTNVLILDEPTNHLDVLAKEALKKALQKYQGTVILVSHEIEWAEDICDVEFNIAD